MKNLMNYRFMAIAMLLISFLFSSCQDELDVLEGGDVSSETITASSATAILMKNTSANDGSYDNIIDRFSCGNVVLPVTVSVNGIEVIVDSEEDLEVIEQLFDKYEDDLDILEIAFPITIVMGDFSEVVIENQDQLEALIDSCTGEDDDIECIDFKYPITFFTYDSENQQTGSVVIESDKQLYRFLEEMKETDRISVQFPVGMTLSDGSEITVTNNQELREAISAARDLCDEDDDNDYNDDDFTKERLDNYLIECHWVVTELVRDNMDHTDQYRAFVLDFNEDGTLKARTDTGIVAEGTWSTRITDRGAMIKLTFPELADFSLEWFVYEIEEGKIKLYTENGNRIRMERACINIDDPARLRAILKECSWVIKKVKYQGEEVDRLLGYEFKFHPENVVTLSNSEITSEGSWEVSVDTHGVPVLAMEFGNEPVISFTWPLKELKERRLRFEVGDYELVVVRFCEGDDINDGDIFEIKNIMKEGNWAVASYVDNGVNETESYNGYTFNFKIENLVSVSQNTDPLLNGLWRVIRDDEGHLKFMLNFGDDLTLSEFNDDWSIVSVSNTRIELKDQSSDGSLDTLVFERL